MRMDYDNTLKTFQEQGSSIRIESNTFLSVQEEPAVYLIEKGSLNLFAIELEEGKAEGPRTLMSTWFEKSILFFIDQDVTLPHMKMFAISEEKTHLWKIPYSKISEYLAHDDSLKSYFIHHLDQWILKIASFKKKTESYHKELFITSSQELICEQGTVYCIKRLHTPTDRATLLWIEIREGRTVLCSYPDITVSEGDPSFPMAEQFCLKNETPLRCYIHTTSDLIANATWVPCLNFFHKKLFQLFFLYKDIEDAKVISSLHQKNEEEQQALDAAFKKMISLLNPEDIVSLTVSTDPLFRALQALGKAIKCTFILPSDMPLHKDASLQIEAICEASGIKHRQVRLIHNWWKEDAGPLLAFFGEPQHPVVLLPKRGKYEMIFPLTNKKKIVSKKIADQFVRFGFIFYRPFPEHLKTAKEVIVFYLQNNYKEFFPVIAYSSLASLINLFVPYATAQIFNRAIPDANTSVLLQLTGGLLITAVTYAAFLYLRAIGLVRLSGLASNQIQSAIWDRLLKLPVSFFRHYTTGNLVSKVTSFDQVRSLLSDNSARIILSGIFSLFYLIAMFFYSPMLSLMALLLMGGALGVTLIAFAYRLRFQTKVQRLFSQINGVLVQIISGVSKLRVAGAENNAFSYWAQLFIKMKKNELTSQYIQTIISSMTTFLPIFAYLIIFGTVMLVKKERGMSVGYFLAFNAAFSIFSTAIFDLCNAIMDLIDIPPLWKNVKDILEAPQEIVTEKVKIGKLTGDICIDEVSFWYDRGGAQILDRISIKIAPQEFIAIVGPSGCGKSTLIRLLLGFEKPDLGTLYYEGKDLASLNPHKLRRQIGVVLQGAGLIAGTLYDNLVCGGIYSKQDVEECLTLSGFDEDMESFPMGLHTFIPMGGETLSGGQKQRLMIARALLPKPKILIFDEATSALDNKVQDQVSKNIDALDVTRIVIAHRLSSIKNADRIYVMEHGKIIQTGAFEALSEEAGLFQDMLERQKL